MQAEAGMMSETISLPDDLVGLIIGRGGENIMRMQRETGCRIQITQSMPGTKERPCTLSGTVEQIDVCRNMLNEIVSRSQAGTLGNNFNLASGGLQGMGDGMDKSVTIDIPPDKCGLIIGKGGETIKMLQQTLGVKMLLIQESTENLGLAKPLKITGPQINIDNAVNMIHQMMANRDQQIAQQKMDGNADPSMFGDDANRSFIPVPKAAVGVVIGKGGDMINQIQDETGTRIQFKPEEPGLPERMCSVTGRKDGVDAAIRKIHQIIQNVQERDGQRMGGTAGGGAIGGGGGGGGGGGPPGFGQWEGTNQNRGQNMGGHTTAEHLVPANRTGLVIGKGGETIKQINMQSGAHAEIQRNPPPGSDLNYKTFLIKGTQEQITAARRLIQEKVDAGPGGTTNNQGYRGQIGGGPPGQPPPSAYAQPPPSSRHMADSPLQATRPRPSCKPHHKHNQLHNHSSSNSHGEDSFNSGTHQLLQHPSRMELNWANLWLIVMLQPGSHIFSYMVKRKLFSNLQLPLQLLLLLPVNQITPSNGMST
uniref:Far upstream element-binding protein n=1 Tax=Phallusia mammillata TaxID=59560 RepID=A0A6F9DDC9_9ASCI|nr:far upstream element-binding protein [Phallusia mammillata]